MEPRMLDKINDLHRLRCEHNEVMNKMDAIAKEVLDECQQMLIKSGLTLEDLRQHMIPF